MAFDLSKWKFTNADHARGEPPPADSVEWSFIPQSAANMMARQRSKATVLKGDEKKAEAPKPWLWGLAGAIAGLVVGSWGRGD